MQFVLILLLALLSGYLLTLFFRLIRKYILWYYMIDVRAKTQEDILKSLQHIEQMLEEQKGSPTER